MLMAVGNVALVAIGALVVVMPVETLGGGYTSLGGTRECSYLVGGSLPPNIDAVVGRSAGRYWAFEEHVARMVPKTCRSPLRRVVYI